MKNKTKITLTLTLAVMFAALTLISGVLAVSFVLQESNHIQVQVSSGTVQVPVSISVSGTAITDQDPLTITATTASNGNGLTAKFYDGTTLLGAQTIALTGGLYKASITVPAGQLSIGTHDIATKP
jgi:hypothetical protein